MLVCHLDDSGEKAEPVVTLAGYVGTAEGWARFEPQSRDFFDSEGIKYLHTVDLHHLRCQFDGWDRARTHAFATRLFEMVGDVAPVGVEFSVDKKEFNRGKREMGMTREGSALTFCFKGLLQNMMADPAFADVLSWDGVDLSFVVESGQRSEPMVKEFDRLKAIGAHGGVLRSMVLEDKTSLIALQAADFLAYFSRRLRCMDKGHRRFGDELEFFQTATKGVKVHHQFLATGFS